MLSSIQTELALARLALDLGAEAYGGPLAQPETELIAAASNVVASPRDVEQARTQILEGQDPLGDTLCAIRSGVKRRALGTFYTPIEIVNPMIEWAFRVTPSRFVDPGCGSGRFAAAALRRVADLEILAIDLDPLATLLTRATVAVLGNRTTRVMCEDYLTCSIPRHDGVTAYVGNPPYVRHHDLSPETKAWATTAATSVGHQISALSGLHALFFVATQLHAAVGDVGCFVTSAEWLDVGYGSIVRTLFTNGLGGMALDLIDPQAVPFKDAQTTALISCFSPGAKQSVVAIGLARTPGDLDELEGGRRVQQLELTSGERWSHLFRRDAQTAQVGRRLGEFARAHRGFATGANGFFLMTRDQAKERGLTDWVRPAITTAAEILGADGVVRDTESLRVVLDLPIDLDRAAHPAVDKYLSLGEEHDLHLRYLCSHRKPWFHIGLGKPAPVVVSYMARQAPRFAINPDGLALLNIGHGIFPTADLSQDELSELVQGLNAARERYRGRGRTYYGVLEKFEPGEIEALTLPDEITSPTPRGVDRSPASAQ